jgi:hypothetical protein
MPRASSEARRARENDLFRVEVDESSRQGFDGIPSGRDAVAEHPATTQRREHVIEFCVAVKPESGRTQNPTGRRALAHVVVHEQTQPLGRSSSQLRGQLRDGKRPAHGHENVLQEVPTPIGARRCAHSYKPRRRTTTFMTVRSAVRHVAFTSDDGS